MDKNDVWIAAIAKLSQMTLLTTDADFDHLHPNHPGPNSHRREYRQCVAMN